MTWSRLMLLTPEDAMHDVVETKHMAPEVV